MCLSIEKLCKLVELIITCSCNTGMLNNLKKTFFISELLAFTFKHSLGNDFVSQVPLLRLSWLFSEVISCRDKNKTQQVGQLMIRFHFIKIPTLGPDLSGDEQLSRRFFNTDGSRIFYRVGVKTGQAVPT